MSQYEDYYEPSEFDEKMEEFKNYLRESVKKDTLDQIDRLTKENKKLRDEVSVLKNENKELENRNKVSVTSDIITQLIVNNIGAHNVYRIIETLFPKTFDEKLTGGCPLFWHTYVNYYENRKDIVSLLRFAGVEIPDELDSVVLPHEWNDELLDKFFKTMGAHYVCNNCIYSENLQFWTWRMAAHPFDSNYFSCYDEIPWQFVLRNPLLNSKEYALRMADAINKGHHGEYFSRICRYQTLDDDVLQTIVDNISVKSGSMNTLVSEFLIENIDRITNKKTLDYLYSIVHKKYGGDSSILNMPKEYQIQYARHLVDINKRFSFLQKTNFSKEEKIAIMNDLFEEI